MIMFMAMKDAGIKRLLYAK